MALDLIHLKNTYAHNRAFLIALATIAVLYIPLVMLSTVPWSTPLPTLPGALPIPAATSTPADTFLYIEVTDSCGPYYDGGDCVNMRSGPGTSFRSVARLRTGVVLKVAETVEADGMTWYKILFDEGVRFPERVTGNWYVAAPYVRLFTDPGDQVSDHDTPVSSKRIVVDLSSQMLYAYDGDTSFMQEPISTGLDSTPTPLGTYTIFKKTPSRYMQGPIPGVSDQYYDLPGVPWDLYFTSGGAVIHGAYWHDHFGERWSHGCVNLPPEQAKKLYLWADVGMFVTIQK